MIRHLARVSCSYPLAYAHGVWIKNCSSLRQPIFCLLEDVIGYVSFNIGASFNHCNIPMKKIVIGSAIALMMAAPLASAKTFTLTIVNKTSSVLEAFYASPTNENDWEEDLLGDDAIRPNGRYVVRFRDDRGVCNYDLRFEFRDTRLETLEDTQNLCKIKEYEITE